MSNLKDIKPKTLNEIIEESKSYKITINAAHIETNLICVECLDEIDFMAHNYGTPEFPVCIHCYTLAQSK